MENRSPFRRIAPSLAVGLALTLAGAVQAAAQHLEVEPNNPCASAQDLTAAALPLSVDGSLDTPPDVPDVDFYRFSAPAGSVLTIRQEQAGAQPVDPYLAVLTSDCAWLAIDGDSGGGVNAQIRIAVPDDGVFVVAASSSGDWSFTGNGASAGTYRVTVQQERAAHSITGRVVDARTGAALSFAYVQLMRCTGGDCSEFVGYAYTSPDGSFYFASGHWSVFGQPLLVGDYQLSIIRYSYQDTTYGPFHAAESAVMDLGAVPMTTVPTLGSVRGRAVDGVTGAPLSGRAMPFSYAELLYCEQGYSFCYPVRQARPDDQGSFRFESTTEMPLWTGEYRVRLSADQYETTESASVMVGDGQHVDLGDQRVKSYPVRMNLLSSCAAIPAEGGTCGFTVRIANGRGSHLEGEAWSIIDGTGIGALSYATTFQVGSPRTLSLAPGATADVPFSFFVPASVNNGAYVCATAYTGQRPNNFQTLGRHDLFCLFKGLEGFSLVPEEQKREVLHDLKRKASGRP